MRRRLQFGPLTLSLFLAAVAAVPAAAQRHSLGSAPPTAPPPPVPHTVAPVVPAVVATHTGQPQPSSPAIHALAPAAPPPRPNPYLYGPMPGPVAPVSSGMGAIQFASASNTIPAPQTLTRQLDSNDERTRSGVLSSLGAPGQYLGAGHVPYPHSVQLDMLQLSNSDELDAILTVELDQHVVSAVLVPEGESWRRIATLSFASSFSSGTTTPSSFVRPLRSWLQPGRYRAVYHATVVGSGGDFTENEADLRIVNGKAMVVLSFVSGARQCDNTGQLRPPHQNCELIQRWLEPDPTDPTHHFTLITGVGHMSAHDADDPLTRSRNYRLTRLRSFACQPFIFSDSGMKFEPTANSGPCSGREPSQRAEHAPSSPSTPSTATPVASPKP